MTTLATTQSVGTFLAGAAPDRTPPEALERARTALADFIGCALAGAPQQTTARILRFARSQGTTGPCTVIGLNTRLGSGLTALVNGTSGHALDYDDVNFHMIGHTGVAVFPAILALAEATGRSLEEVLGAYVVGFDVGNKLGLLLNPVHYERGWHATGTLGTLAAAAGCANLLRLNESQATMAMAIAVSLASGIRQNFGTDTKPLHAGRAAENGVTAALLAQDGFTADPTALEGRWGFGEVLGQTDHHLAERSITLGEPWDIVTDGFCTKMYPSCVSTHTAIDAALLMREREGLDIREAVTIEIGVVHLTPKILIHDNPRTGLEGKFSMPYCLSRALLDGHVTMADFENDRLGEADVREVMSRVHMYVDPRVDDAWTTDKARPVILDVTMRDGRSFSQRVDAPSGSPERPASAATLRTKFVDCARPVLGAVGAERTVEQLATAPGSTPVAELLSWVSGPATARS